MKTTKLEIQRIWVLAMAHIDFETYRWLIEQAALNQKIGCAWVLDVTMRCGASCVHVRVPDPNLDLEAVAANTPPGLYAILTKAIEARIARVEFDRDGLTFIGLPTFEW